ncbi:flagellar protein FliT [Syntrophomonas palmitatica]|uniref:flagellar protein FliT n=1 Tax=Syntrophomonas palmitatica TaxID=402877 RepID=UPI0012EE194A|nr:flagellar protein FliT [Syntrophomonas palmitatica]
MIIQLIRENDSRTIKEAEKKMKQISAKLNETRANQKAFNAYSQEEPYDGGYFVDRKN